ncbi:copper oxidase [Pseudonocardia sp. MCCB 268]|nr:copper oxidase [Pseudonocardia cytotoxica]
MAESSAGQNKATIGAVLGPARSARRPSALTGRWRRPSGSRRTGWWEPAILIMPHAGTIELTIINDDKNTHACLLPSNGDKQSIGLVNHSRAAPPLELDAVPAATGTARRPVTTRPRPTAAIVVTGEVPPEYSSTDPPSCGRRRQEP